MTQTKCPPRQTGGGKKTDNGKATVGKEYLASLALVNGKCPGCGYYHPAAPLRAAFCRLTGSRQLPVEGCRFFNGGALC